MKKRMYETEKEVKAAKSKATLRYLKRKNLKSFSLCFDLDIDEEKAVAEEMARQKGMTGIKPYIMSLVMRDKPYIMLLASCHAAMRDLKVMEEDTSDTGKDTKKD